MYGLLLSESPRGPSTKSNENDEPLSFSLYLSSPNIQKYVLVVVVCMRWWAGHGWTLHLELDHVQSVMQTCWRSHDVEPEDFVLVTDDCFKYFWESFVEKIISFSVSVLGQNCNDQPSVQGPCRGFFQKWSYNSGSCEQFVYGGCRGSQNRFDTQTQCQAACVGRWCELKILFNVYSFIDHCWCRSSGSGVSRPFFNQGSSCNSSPFVFGNCGGNIRRWSYVWQTRSCQPFIYSGCGGGQNSFSSQSDCIRSCIL